MIKLFMTDDSEMLFFEMITLINYKIINSQTFFKFQEYYFHTIKNKP